MATNDKHHEWKSEDLLALSGAMRLISNKANAIAMDATCISGDFANVAGMPREVAADKAMSLVEDVSKLLERLNDLAGANMFSVGIVEMLKARRG